ncbi:MAG: Gfo/Idh/MocA family oxidoreductase [Treponema sp.]|jgi:predicted dehydrogenase|nr:Gfo/Idh/MocA family oxidoreductase [Treponema sp.]
MDKIPVAIVGLGRIASLLEEDPRREKPCTHAGAIAANGGCTLAAGCDTNGERRGLFAERWQVPVYADVAAMLEKHAPGILVIATHPDSHEQYCRLARDRGVPVVICEKPLADTLGRARRIARLEGRGNGKAAGGLRIVTNHERRYSADYIQARALLESGRLGALLGVRGCLYMGRGSRLLDVLWHDGTHLADAIMFLSGRLLRHRRSFGADLASKEGTAWLEGRLTALAGQESPPGLPGGYIPAIIEVGARRDHLVFELEFSSEKGRLRIGNGVYEVWESAESPYAQGFRSLKLADDRFEGKTGYFANMVADAVACVREPARLPRSSATDGLRVIEYLASVRKWR